MKGREKRRRRNSKERRNEETKRIREVDYDTRKS
jgi:hypothetical protein